MCCRLCSALQLKKNTVLPNVTLDSLTSLCISPSDTSPANPKVCTHCCSCTHTVRVAWPYSPRMSVPRTQMCEYWITRRRAPALTSLTVRHLNCITDNICARMCAAWYVCMMFWLHTLKTATKHHTANLLTTCPRTHAHVCVGVSQHQGQHAPPPRHVLL